MNKKQLAAKRRRYRNAKRQRVLRAYRDKHKLCRTCGAKAVKSKRTGEVSKQCGRHLRSDADRKLTSYNELSWDSKPAGPCRNGGSTANDPELRWMK